MILQMMSPDQIDKVPQYFKGGVRQQPFAAQC